MVQHTKTMDEKLLHMSLVMFPGNAFPCCYLFVRARSVPYSLLFHILETLFVCPRHFCCLPGFQHSRSLNIGMRRTVPLKSRGLMDPKNGEAKIHFLCSNNMDSNTSHTQNPTPSEKMILPKQHLTEIISLARSDPPFSPSGRHPLMSSTKFDQDRLGLDVL